MLPSEKALRREGRSRNFKLPDFIYLSHRNAARFSPLPHLKPSELAAAGRVAGYQGAYIDACGGFCRPGLLNVSTEVHVFATAAQASRFIATQRAAYARLIGKRGKYGGRVTSVRPFDAGVFGDEVVGLRSGQSIPYTETYTETHRETLIMFRVRQVFGLTRAVIFNRQAYADAQATALARILEKRIRAVLGRKP